jgi:hypothetical protein
MAIIEIKTGLDYEGCLLCGEALVNFHDPIEMKCAFCGTMHNAKAHCTEMHYVCDTCQHLSAGDVVQTICLRSDKTDPMALAVEIMSSPAVKMHGPEHHFIVPAVLMTCINNKHGDFPDLKDRIDFVRKIAGETVPNCSFDLRTCGAAIGTGIFLEMLNNHDAATEDEWSLSKNIVADSLTKIADSGGPRCCKRDTYLALEASVEFLSDKYAIELPTSQAKCTFSLRNNSCKREECNFYNMSNSLV